MARFLCLGTILLALAGHLMDASDSRAAGGQDTQKPDDQAAKKGGPALEGRISDEAGLPLRGAKVILYGGMATRWKIAEAETDADGRYRFDSVQSTLIKDSSERSLGPVRGRPRRASHPRRGGRAVLAQHHGSPASRATSRRST